MATSYVLTDVYTSGCMVVFVADNIATIDDHFVYWGSDKVRLPDARACYAAMLQHLAVATVCTSGTYHLPVAYYQAPQHFVNGQFNPLAHFSMVLQFATNVHEDN